MPVPNDMRPSSSAGDLFRSLERGIHRKGGCTPNQPRLVNYEADDSSHFPVCAVPVSPLSFCPLLWVISLLWSLGQLTTHGSSGSSSTGSRRFEDMDNGDRCTLHRSNPYLMITPGPGNYSQNVQSCKNPFFRIEFFSTLAYHEEPPLSILDGRVPAASLGYLKEKYIYNFFL